LPDTVLIRTLGTVSSVNEVIPQQKSPIFHRFFVTAALIFIPASIIFSAYMIFFFDPDSKALPNPGVIELQRSQEQYAADLSQCQRLRSKDLVEMGAEELDQLQVCRTKRMW
jgi:hypothetical protein